VRSTCFDFELRKLQKDALLAKKKTSPRSTKPQKTETLTRRYPLGGTLQEVELKIPHPTSGEKELLFLVSLTRSKPGIGCLVVCSKLEHMTLWDFYKAYERIAYPDLPMMK
jgi:hypothetical protein